MPANLLILPLLGGFYFLHFCHQFRFRSQNLDGNRLIIHSAMAGFVFLFGGRLLTYLSGLWLPLRWLQWWHGFAPVDFLGTGMASLAIGLSAPHLWNLFSEEEAERQKAIFQHGDAFLNLLRQAEVNNDLVAVTMSTRKVYIGYVARSTDLRPTEKYFELLPVLSGYRHEKTLKFSRTTYYGDVLQNSGRNAEEFILTLPLSEVRSASLFDMDLSLEYFEDDVSSGGFFDR